MNPAEFDARLESLATLASDAQRAERTRARCRAALQRRAQRTSVEGRGPETAAIAASGLRLRKAAAGAVGLVCVVYVVSLIATTLRLQFWNP